ncbi:MAG: thioredoxin family protein [Ferruginibacter sp.]
MKKYLFLVLLITANKYLFAQTPYTSSRDTKDSAVTILNGIISKYALQNYPAFTWYTSNQKTYTPAIDIVNAMETSKDKVQFVLFGGTWCEDTQFILPKFFKLQEQSGFPDKSISFFAVDRSKQTLGNVAGAFKITNVPTIIVMKDGKEVGRVVEYGKTGKWDVELAEFLK